MGPVKRNRRALIAGVLLVAFALRALIPQGFMPASGRPFALELCWDGLPPAMLARAEPAQAASMDMGSMPMGSMDDSMPMDSMPMGSMDDSMPMGSMPGSTHREAVGYALSHAGHHQGGHHPGGHPSASEHCVFGAAWSPGPITHCPQPSDFSCPPPLRALAVVSIASAVRLVYLPPSRAPPGRLS